MTLQQVIDDFEAQIKHLTRAQVLGAIQARQNKILPPLIDEFGDPQTAVAIVGMFVMGAVLSDGTLALDEYRIFSETLNFALGEYISREKCQELLESSMEECEQALGTLSDILSSLDFELQAELVRVCVAILSVDGIMTIPEKNWLLRLVSEAE